MNKFNVNELKEYEKYIPSRELTLSFEKVFHIFHLSSSLTCTSPRIL